MIDIKVEIDTKGLDQFRQFSERRVRAAVATALTRTASEARKAWRQELTAKLDRPTPYTTNSVRTEMAKADKLEAVVAIKDQGDGVVPAEYLGTQQRGGDRNLRKFERALVASKAMPPGYKVVPSRYALLDAYGNISRAQIVSVLRSIGGNVLSPGYQRVISKSASKRASKAKPYLAVWPDAKSGLAPGVYQSKGRDLQQVFAYVRNVVYRQRIDLYQRTRDIVGQQLQAQFDRAMRESAARLAAK